MKKLPPELETLTHCGYTEDMLDQLTKWCPVYSEEDDFETIQELLQQGDLKQLMENLRSAELYRPMVQYLVFHFQTELCGNDDIPEDFVETYCQTVFKEMEGGNTLPKSPKTKQMLALLEDTYKAKGAVVQGSKGKLIYSTLSCDAAKTWKRDALKKALFHHTMTDSQFIMMAVMTDMPIELAAVFLKKFLQRRSFQLWNLEELIAYLCLKEHIREPLQFYREAYQVYTEGFLDDQTPVYQETGNLLQQLELVIKELEADGNRKVWNGSKLADKFCDFLRNYKIRTAGRAENWVNFARKKAKTEKPAAVYYDRGQREFDRMRREIAQKINWEKNIISQDEFYSLIYEEAECVIKEKLEEEERRLQDFLEEQYEILEIITPMFQKYGITEQRLSMYRIKERKVTPPVPIRRCDMVTMAFLYECNGCVEKSEEWQECSEYIDTWRQRSKHLSKQTLKRKWIDEILVQPINDKLIECGYSPLYYANPYDCFIIYLLTCEQPVETYQLLWVMYMENEKRSKSK